MIGKCSGINQVREYNERIFAILYPVDRARCRTEMQERDAGPFSGQREYYR